MIIDIPLYLDWKTRVQKNGLSYISSVVNGGRTCYAFDGTVVYLCKPTLADLTDYETTMMANEANRVGNQIDPLNYTANLYYRGTGIINGTVLAGTTGSLDYTVPKIYKINGTQVILAGHSLGDSLSFQVVAPDGVTVLNEFATNWYVAPDKNDQGVIKVEYPATVYPGLMIRISYTSTGLNDVRVLVNACFHEEIIP